MKRMSMIINTTSISNIQLSKRRHPKHPINPHKPHPKPHNLKNILGDLTRSTGKCSSCGH